MGERTHFEKLEVYQRAEELADAVWSVVADWEGLAKGTIGKQLVRAADSVGANIAEGSGRGTPKDQRYFARMARGSLYETKHWLRRAVRRHLLTDDQIQHLKPIVDSLAPLLNGYIRSLDRKADAD